MLAQFTEDVNRIANFLGTCIELARSCGDETFASTLSNTRTELDNFSFNVAVVGSIKRGKSTLINTLLRRTDDALSPIDDEVCTSAIVKYRNYKAGMPHDPHAMVYYANAPETGHRVGYEALREIIRQKEGDDPSKQVLGIEVYGDFPSLGNCCLVDTPGANSTVERHGKLVAQFLPSADAIILPIIWDQSMTDSDRKMLRRLSAIAQRRIFYVLTMVDEMPPEYAPAVTAKMVECIQQAGLTVPETIYQVACLQVYDALHNGKSEECIQALRQEWGVSRLETDLEDFMLHGTREGHELVTRLRQALSLVETHLNEKKALNEGIISANNESPEELKDKCERVRSGFDDFQKGLKEDLDRFARKWDRQVEISLGEFESRTTPIATDIRRALEEKGGYPTDDLICDTVRPHIEATVTKLEERLAPLVRELNKGLADSTELYASQVKGSPLGTFLRVLGTIGNIADAITNLGFLRDLLNAVPEGDTAVGRVAKGAARVAAKTVPAVGMLSKRFAQVLFVAESLFEVGKWLARNQLPSVVGQAMKQVRDDLEKQLAGWKSDVVIRCEDLMVDQRREMNSKLEDLSRKLSTLDPAAREQAQRENERIEALLRDEAVICSSILAFSCEQE